MKKCAAYRSSEWASRPSGCERRVSSPWGQSPVGTHWKTRGLDPERIEAFFLGNFAGQAFVGQNHIAPMVAHATGLGAVPCTRLEGACASGGLAIAAGGAGRGLGSGGFRPHRGCGEDDFRRDGRDGLHPRRRRRRGGGGARWLHVSPPFSASSPGVTCTSTVRRARRSPMWR